MKESVKEFLVLLREVQKIDLEFPLQYAVCLGEIALDEGLSLTDLSDRTGMPLSTVSRIVGALSKHRQKGTAYGLVTVAISSTERRRKELFLSTQGRVVVNDISTLIERQHMERRRA